MATDNAAAVTGEKRKREDDAQPAPSSETLAPSDPSQNPLYKTSLCSYFRRHGASCSHGAGCQYAHGEEELRKRPDGTWDPTSERGKKGMKNESGERCEVGEKDEEIMMTEMVGDGDEGGDGGESGDAGLSKCLVHLPRKWHAEQLRKFLDEQGVAFKAAKKKKGMTVGFVSFETAEQVKSAVEGLQGKAAGNKTLKVADVIPRSFEKNVKSAMALHQNAPKGLEAPSTVENASLPESLDGTLTSNTDGNSSIPRAKSAREAVTPLALMPYGDQLEHKKNSVMQILKKLTRNARKACPSGVSLPDWVLKSREIGGLPCKLEGILASPLVNGYRNKCEFSVGFSLQGKPTVGFMLGNFREGVTAVEEPTECPNVSRIACKYAKILQDFLQHSELPLWNRFKNTGFWRQLTVREGRALGKIIDAESSDVNISEVLLMVQVCSVGINNKLLTSELERLAQAFASGSAESSPPLPLTALVIQDHQGVSNVAPADAPLRSLPISRPESVSELQVATSIEEARIHDYISNLRFCISPTAFFQVNTVAAEKLYSLAGDWAGLGPDTLLFDICCGTGTIGLTLAHRVGMVVGIEMNASAVSDAYRNAEINAIKNCRFVCGKAEDVLASLLKEYLNEPQKQDEGANKSETSDMKVSDAEQKDVSVDNLTESEVNPSNKTESSDMKVSDAGQKDISVDNTTKLEVKSELSPSHNSGNGDTANTHSAEICTSADGVQQSEASLNHKAENGEGASLSSSSGRQDLKSDGEKSPTVKDGEALLPQFKNIVAIVDPPRVGLHPTVTKALRTHQRLRRLVYISCNPETLVANAIELCTPSPGNNEKGSKGNRGWRGMSSAGLARHRVKSMPNSEPFRPVKAMAVDLFPHTLHCEMVMLLER